MNTTLFLNTDLCLELTCVMGHFLWQGMIIGAIAVIVVWCLRGASARARYNVWLLSMLAMLACMPVTMLISSQSDIHIQPGPVASVTDQEPEELSPSAEATSYVTAERTDVVIESTQPGESPPRAVPSTGMAAPPLSELSISETEPPGTEASYMNALSPWMISGYLVGVGAMFLRVLAGSFGASRLRHNASPSSGKDILDIVSQQADILGVRLLPAIRICGRISVPVIVGVIRPTLLLPISMLTGVDSECFRAIVTHELAHLRRFDPVALLFQRLAEMLLFFHPVIWIVSRRIELERENSCDDMVLTAGISPIGYARSLLQVAESCVNNHQPQLAASVLAASGERPSQLRRRILRMIDPKTITSPMRLNVRSMLTVAVTMLLLLGAPLLLHSRPEATLKADDTPAKEEATKDLPSQYDHFLYMRHNPVGGLAKTDSLVLATVTPDGFEKKDIFEKNNLGLGWHPLGVTGGKVYGIKIDDLVKFDIATGKARLIEPYVSWNSCTVRDGRLYAVVSGFLRIYDFNRQSTRDVGEVKHSWSRMPIALSPDGSQMAYFQDFGRWMAPTSFRLNIMDMRTGKVRQVGPIVHSMTFMTGGGDWTEGPPMIWLDGKTLLIVRDIPVKSPEDPAAYVGFAGGQVKMATLNIDSGKLTDLLTLPKWKRGLLEPYLRPLGPDGIPRIVMGKLGQFRIDIKKKRLVEDNTIAGDFQWVYGGEPEKLLSGKTLLIEAKKIPEFSVSLDGRRAAWMTKRYDSNLNFFDENQKQVRKVATGWFAIEHSFHKPDENGILWARADDLKPSRATEAQPGWKPFTTRPWPLPPQDREPDKRSDVADSLTLTLLTDKNKYDLHEPIEMTVVLKNKSDKEVAFERPKGYCHYFSLSIRTPRTSGEIGGFHEAEKLFSSNPVVIPPGESIRITKQIESPYAGKHILSGQFRINIGNWKGRTEAQTVAFEIVKSDDNDRLLAGKLTRYMALCKSEFDKNPMTCSYSRFLDLGDGAVPFLAKELRASDNPKFRQRMGYALARIANEDALPYFQELLDGDMKHDQGMVLDGLLNMVQRKRDGEEALPILIGALQHKNPGVSRGAATRLAKIHDPRAVEGMRKTVLETDRPTGLIAARYLAATENVDLALWLTRAIDDPTPARVGAAHAIVPELEKTWKTDFGSLPENMGWADRSRASGVLDQYKDVLRKWQRWAAEHPRYSEHFFDEDRKDWPKAKPAEEKQSTNWGAVIKKLAKEWKPADHAQNIRYVCSSNGEYALFYSGDGSGGRITGWGGLYCSCSAERDCFMEKRCCA